MQKITPFLWFDHQAEEAANYYVSIFKDSKITSITHYNEGGAAASGQPAGSVMTVAFELNGQKFVALNGGPHFTFNEAISFVVDCRDQKEVDDLWEKLTNGGQAGPCGWLKDRFGISWQVVPKQLDELLTGSDPQKAGRVWQAMTQMQKIDIAALQRAAGAA